MSAVRPQPLTPGESAARPSGEHRRVFEVFDRLRELVPEARAAALAGEGGLSDAQRRAVRELLDHDGPTDEFLGAPVTAATATLVSMIDDAPVPEAIGGYRVIRLLGRGTFGAVYLAEQARPKRLVAIKILRRGQQGAAAGRFVFEAEALARLDHPNITKVLELGTAGECPFLVMEYVEGEPLDVYAEGKRIGVVARIRLMIDVCLGMAHAHGRGVLHRDLSPKNILVTAGAEGRDGTPKILDFGLAFEMNATRQEALRHTLPGSVVGTLRYICPEQINASGGGGPAVASDVRGDVYALGVIAFELLGGRHPYLEPGSSFGEAVSRLSAAHLSPRFAMAAKRGEGDLCAVLAKAVERDPARRYQSAAAFADDLARCLDGRPVAAMPASWWYRTRRFCGRHRALTAAALVAAVFATAGISATGVTLRSEAQSRASALNALDVVVSGMLSPLGPRIGTLDERERLLADIERDLEAMNARTPDDPRSVRVYSTFLVARGDIARDRGRVDDAATNYAAAVRAGEHLRALLPGDPTVGHALSISIVKLGDVAAQRGKAELKRELYRRALALDESLVESHPDNLGLLSNLFWSFYRVSELREEPEAYRTALVERLDEVAAKMRALAPDEWRTLEAVAYANLVVTRGMPHTAEHASKLLIALEASERLVKQFPDSIVHNSTLMRALLRLLALRDGLLEPGMRERFLVRSDEIDQSFTRSQGELRFEDADLFCLARARFDVAWHAGEIDEASRQATRALELARRPVGAPFGVPIDYFNLADVLTNVTQPLARLTGRELRPDEDRAYIERLAAEVVKRFPLDQEAANVAVTIRGMLVSE